MDASYRSEEQRFDSWYLKRGLLKEERIVETRPLVTDIYPISKWKEEFARFEFLTRPKAWSFELPNSALQPQRVEVRPFNQFLKKAIGGKCVLTEGRSLRYVKRDLR